MRTTKLPIMLFIFLFSASPMFADAPEYVPGEILVKFKPGVSVSSISTSSPNLFRMEKVFKSKGVGERFFITKHGKERRIPDVSNVYKLIFTENIDVKKIVEEYSKNPDVVYAEPNYIREVFSPNDPYYTNSTSSYNQWGLFKILLSPAESSDSGWSITKGSTEVAIAVIDSGVDWDHPDLSANIWINWDEFNGTPFVDDDGNGFVDDVRGWDFVSVTGGLAIGEDGGPRDNNPADFDGHGTHVAGIASAATDNNFGVAGAGWLCKIMAIRAAYRASNGLSYLADADAAAAIEYAASMEADVINMSFGGPAYSDTIRDAVDVAYASGCFLVAAAGNANSSLMAYPAALSNVMAVAATDRSDNKASYSNYGPWIDVSAPGGDGATYDWIFSTYVDAYAWATGTSMASPFVAGLGALLKSANPSYTNDKIFERIKGTTDYVRYLVDGDLGTGRINAYYALASNVAIILQPYQGSTVYETIDIIGTATWEGGGSYRVATAEGTLPASEEYVTLLESSDKKLNDILATWNTTALNGPHTIKLTINGLSSAEATRVINIGTPSSRVVTLGDSLGGPNPYNPDKDGNYIIHYKLSANADTTVAIYDTKGTLLWQKKFSSPDEGARQGDNKVEWRGTGFSGESLANGIYIYQIVSNNRLLDHGKIILLR